ncbi:MAG: hypothetical protein DHS20C21_07810 [Gemmatimonadota bacterium]|nr:MAG: hypothetical protein DHS20C21_07810 [Gemmatimonadota bacterium]
MNRFIVPLALVAAVSLLAACSSTTTVQVPPQMDLRTYGTVGMIEFSSDAPNDLRQEASREFLAAIQAAQPGVPVLELGNERRVLDAVGGSRMDPETIRAIGELYHVDVLVHGVLDAQEVRPKVAIGGNVESLSAKAEIEGSLATKIYDTRSAATVWTGNAHGKETLASLRVSDGGLSGLGAAHPDDAHEKLVRNLVASATRDFRPSYLRQRVR